MNGPETIGEVQRVGMVIGIHEHMLPAYRDLHADSHPGVRDLLTRANIRNFSIFVQRLPDGQHYLFGYYEYTGADYRADMDRLNREPRNAAWLAMTDPMQIPFPGEESWRMMEPVYYNP